MALSVRVFGLNPWSVLLPQALAGVAAVGLLYATVRRWFPSWAALLAGAVLAGTPVAVLMFRFDNPDALLVLLLVAAAYATGSRPYIGEPQQIAAWVARNFSGSTVDGATVYDLTRPFS